MSDAERRLRAIFELADEALLAMSDDEVRAFYRKHVGDPDADVAALKSMVLRRLQAKRSKP
jgi:hypothetical protein